MNRTFRSANVDEFQDIVASYPFTRAITEIHLHHTWKPRQRDYRGLATIEAMWRHHTRVNGWDDIAQHVTIAPDGAIWLCRNFNWMPASARGFNGNRKAGPFMIEMIGDFDVGQEAITDVQTESVVAVIKAVQQRFGLDAHAIRFHNEMSDKSCPGSGVDKCRWVGWVERYELRRRDARGAAPLFPRQSSRYWELMREMNPDAEQTDEMFEAEHDGGGYGGMAADPGGRGGSSAARELGDERLDALADHVVNLERGRFSSSGRIETTAADVDRLFEERLPREIEEARGAGRRAQFLFYAHGGLVSERNALSLAAGQLGFWRANHVYPIFFVWETGFAETVRQLVKEAVGRIGGTRGRGPLDWFTDKVTDNLIEEIARAGGGGRLWGGMQSSAALACAAGGGAAYVAKRLRKLAKDHGDDVLVHTAGHSAGSIFLAHFMARLARRRVPIRTAHFLAPAIRNELFHEKVAPLLGEAIGHLTLYTMTKRREKRDTVTPLYRKSLLYLVSEALERERGTPILGLEESLRDDRAARELFGLHGTRSTRAEVIWSPSEDSGSGNSSGALTHSGFDEDVATMESVVRRVLGRRDGQPIEPFPSTSSRDVGDYWGDQFEWPSGLEHLALLMDKAPVTQTSGAAAPFSSGSFGAGIAPGAPDGSSGTSPATASGGDRDEHRRARRRALCIGIDAYERAPLAGCVADAHRWKRTLERLGFHVDLLVDGEATAERIVAEVKALVRSGRAGDHLVLQYAGHGTQFDDEDGDEAHGDTPAKDECLCAVDCDFGVGGLVIDDELRIIIDALAEGASMTCFFDCCHSGSASRMALRRGAEGSAGRDVRSRYLPPNEAMRRAYRERAKRVSGASSRGPTVQRDVLFSACHSRELAYESDGQGDFTRQATRLIEEGVVGIDNRGFLERVLAAFGDGPRQTPGIHCEVDARSNRFLGLDGGRPARSGRAPLGRAGTVTE